MFNIARSPSRHSIEPYHGPKALFPVRSATTLDLGSQGAGASIGELDTAGKSECMGIRTRDFSPLLPRNALPTMAVLAVFPERETITSRSNLSKVSYVDIAHALNNLAMSF